VDESGCGKGEGQAVVNSVTNFQVLYNVGNFLPN
jgi:hypothetical protein